VCLVGNTGFNQQALFHRDIGVLQSFDPSRQIQRQSILDYYSDQRPHQGAAQEIIFGTSGFVDFNPFPMSFFSWNSGLAAVTCISVSFLAGYAVRIYPEDGKFQN